MSMYLDHHHHPKVARPWHRLMAAEDEHTLAYRYQCALARIRSLEQAMERQRLLDAGWSPDCASARVRTSGECLPARGDMLWKGGGYALVWFDGSDRPAVWPCANIEGAG